MLELSMNNSRIQYKYIQVCRSSKGSGPEKKQALNFASLKFSTKPEWYLNELTNRKGKTCEKKTYVFLTSEIFS